MNFVYDSQCWFYLLFIQQVAEKKEVTRRLNNIELIGPGRQPGSVSENISFHFLPQGRIWWEQWEKAVIFGIKNYKIAHNCRLHGCIGLRDRIIITGGISTASLWHFFRIQSVNDGEITWPGHGEYYCVTLSNRCSHFNVHLSSIDDMRVWFDTILKQLPFSNIVRW